MAIKKPLVLNDSCEIEELQVGDTIDTQPDTIDRTFTVLTIPGQVVYVDGAASVDLAQANADATSTPIGLAQAGVAAAAVGVVVIDGTLTLSTAEWDAVTGLAGGLVEGDRYYMSPDDPGDIVPQSAIGALLTTGEYCVRIGQACDDVTMRVEMQFARIKKA